MTLNTIREIDALELMRSIETASIDLVLTDPPFNVSYDQKFIRQRVNGEEYTTSMDFGNWDYGYNPIPFLEEAARIIKPTGSLIAFTSEQLLGTYRDWIHEHMRWKCVIVWCKPNPMPSFTKANYLSGVEFIVWGVPKVSVQKGSENFNFIGQAEMKNWFLSPICAGKERIRDPEKHPTQKPEAVIRRLMEVHCRVGGVVVDPYCGYGTVPAVAKKLGINYIAGDINPAYVDVSNRRVEGLSWPDNNKEESSSNIGTEYTTDN